jgi:hypothetical protein
MKKPPDSKFRQTRIESQRLTTRDENNNCRVSGVFKINNQTKMIIMSSKKNIYLINADRKISKVSIENWKKKFRCEIDDKEFASLWDESIYRKLEKMKKKEISRSPVRKMVRNPVKKIKRRPAK